MPQTLPNGTVLNNRYKVRRLLSESPMGAVYLVDDIKITEKPWVCREYLPLPIAASERMAIEDSFHRVVDFLRTLTHPHLVRVIDSFFEGSRTYLVSEYVDGLSLEAISRLTSDPLPEKQVLEWAVQICEPLEYLHGLSTPFYVKDLSPRYLLLDRDGQIKIGGYGLDLFFAKAYKMALPGVAPEINGDQKGSMSADIYSLGACLYILLGRRIPKPPVDPLKRVNPQISEAAGNLVMSCLTEAPEQRPTNVAELQKKFYNVLNPPVEAPPPPPKVTIGDLMKRVEARMLGGIASVFDLGFQLYKRPHYIVLALLVIAVFFFTFNPFAQQPFQKTGPLTYTLCYNNVAVVDPGALRVVGRINNLNAQFAIFSPSDHEAWFASNDGHLAGVSTDTSLITKRINLNQTIGGIAMGPGGVIYVSMDRDNTLTTIGTNGIPLSVTPVGRIPRDIVYDQPANKIFVASGGTSSITVVDAQKYLVSSTISLDSPPSHMALSPDGNNLYVVYNDLQRLDVFSARSNTLLSSAGIGYSGPYSLSASGNMAVVAAHDGDQVVLFRFPGGTNKGVVPIDKPEGAAFSTDGNTAYVCNDSGYLFSISASSGEVLQRDYIGKSPVNLLSVP